MQDNDVDYQTDISHSINGTVKSVFKLIKKEKGFDSDTYNQKYQELFGVSEANRIQRHRTRREALFRWTELFYNTDGAMIIKSGTGNLKWILTLLRFLAALSYILIDESDKNPLNVFRFYLEEEAEVFAEEEEAEVIVAAVKAAEATVVVLAEEDEVAAPESLDFSASLMSLAGPNAGMPYLDLLAAITSPFSYE